ncbi:uncharacterized protein LOC112602300 [Melanaphis sacchari]|uniref:uncharacterized protein LOC112602300 n=1 Tax=Melanaphis sacchari TaxID=742174 RepID=UPI000DC14C66|nr:uncharacterized protein LOC112602300 [Melanaphis sacchari]
MSDSEDSVTLVIDSTEETSLPSRRNIQGKWVRSRQKNMVVDMYLNMHMNYPIMQNKQIMHNISQTSGIGLNSVYSIISKYRKTGTVTSPKNKRNKKCLFNKISNLDRSALRQKVYNFWLKKELPTIDKILRSVNHDPALPNFKRTTLYSTIKKLNFVYVKRNKYNMLMERNDLLIWRQNYLYDIRKYREEGRTVYYLDETWLNVSDCKKKSRVDKTIKSKQDTLNRGQTTGVTNTTGKGQNLIILHIGSHKGFLDNGLTYFVSKRNGVDCYDSKKFHEWFGSILPRLDPNAVIVMDNASYHSVKSEKIPTSHSKKEDILSWLTSKGVVINKPMFKPQLLAKVNEIKGKYVSYVVDNMAKDAGHSVLRLPTNHCELNPMELVWEMVKSYVRQHSISFKIEDVKALANAAIEGVNREKWENFIKHVIAEENKLNEIDKNMDEIIDSLEPCDLTATDDTSDSDDNF